MNDMNDISRLYGQVFGVRPSGMEKLTASASPRRYFRVWGPSGADTVIATIGTSAEEDDAFIYLAGHLRSGGLPVPAILGVSDDRLIYLQEDLGDTTLWDALSSGRKRGGIFSEEQITLLRQAMTDLVEFQFRGAEGIDWSRCYRQMTFDRRSVLFDLHYFKYCFLKPSGVEFDENLLEDEFERMAALLTREPSEVFLYRDFQPRNIMLREGHLTYIDFQGGRRGPEYYDVASFVWQASSGYTDELRKILIKTYLDSFKKHREADESRFMGVLQHFVLFRTLQVLAAYGYRGLYEGKVRFQMSIPSALKNLASLFTEENLFHRALTEYPYIADLAEGLAASASPRPLETPGDPYGRDADSGLLIEVCSFSYMQGIPRDVRGNGGGYVFDCRGMDNPGREARFKHSTGEDADVIEWLEQRGEIQKFLASAYSLADHHIECYLRRGFSHLSFSFGCTGGQHRSVYCAGHLAEHVAERYAGRDVRVKLVHRERGITRDIKVSSPFTPGPCMILAAGMGTRLRPLTDYVPKALAPVGGTPLILSLMDKMYDDGFRQVFINIHHDADMLEEYVSFAQRDCRPGLEVVFSDEREKLLDTGGAVKKVLSGHKLESPMLVHNVDIVSDISLNRFYRSACTLLEASPGSIAALMVSDRESSRKLFFDTRSRLCGWKNLRTGESRGDVGDNLKELAFDGIYVISPEAAGLMERFPDVFSIIDFFLTVCPDHGILGIETSAGYRVKDVGKF